MGRQHHLGLSALVCAEPAFLAALLSVAMYEKSTAFGGAGETPGQANRLPMTSHDERQLPSTALHGRPGIAETDPYRVTLTAVVADAAEETHVLFVPESPPVTLALMVCGPRE